MPASGTNGAHAVTNGHVNGHANGDRNGHGPEHDPDVRRMLEELVEQASRPLDEAQAISGELLTNRAFYDLEMERIFQREWLYIGRQEEIAQPGDWMSAQIGDEPVVVVRGQDMQIRAFSRVCPHRFMDLLSRDNKDQHGRTCDHGNVENFVCPYHAWSFNLDGSMAGAPLMNSSKLFQREKDDYRLEGYQVEVWHGYVFINMDPAAEPLAPRLADLEPMVEQYDMEDWVFVDRVDWPDSPANWKLAMDNGRECYHHLGAHKDTLEPLWPTATVDPDTTESRFWYAQRMFISPEGAVGEEDGHLIHPTVLPTKEGLSAFDRSQYLLIGIYPSMFFALGPDMIITGKWLPTGPASHKFELGTLVHKDNLDHPDLQEAVTESTRWAWDLQVEDSSMLTGIQPMLKSRVAQKRGGALCYLERPVWQFQKYLADRLAGVKIGQ